MLIRNKGFGLVQTLVGVALGAIAFVGVMKIMSNSQQNQKNTEQKLEIDSFMDSITRKLSSKEVCDLNFSGKNLNQEIDKLYSPQGIGGDHVVLIEKSQSYLSNNLRVESMNLSVPQNADSNLVSFSITFKHLRKKGYNVIKKNIILSTKNDGSTIQSCFYNLGDMPSYEFELMAKKVCKGPGVYFDITEGKCYFKSFSQNEFELHNQNAFICEAGFSLRNIIYDFNNYTYTGICEPGVDAEIDCKVKSINADGQFTCLSVNNLVDHTESTVNPGANCSLEYANGGSKMKFNCVGGGSSGGTSGGTTSGTTGGGISGSNGGSDGGVDPTCTHAQATMTTSCNWTECSSGPDTCEPPPCPAGYIQCGGFSDTMSATCGWGGSGPTDYDMIRKRHCKPL